MTPHRVERPGQFETERHRQRLLQPGAAGHHRVAMTSCLRAQRVGKSRDVGVDQVERIVQLQHQRRIQHILAGRTPVHVAPRVAGVGRHRMRQRGDHRYGEVAGIARSVAPRVEIVQFRLALPCDRLRRGDGNHAGCGLRARERRFEVEHALRACAFGENRAHRVGGEQCVRQVERAVNSRKIPSRHRLADAHSTSAPTACPQRPSRSACRDVSPARGTAPRLRHWRGRRGNRCA